MKLKDNFYRLENIRNEGEHRLFSITLLPDCELYRGHFPGNPVCPGVCSIEMIRQCAEYLMGSPLFIRSIKQCRFTAILSPLNCRELTIDVSLSSAEDSIIVTARIYDERDVYVEFKGEMVKKEEQVS